MTADRLVDSARISFAITCLGIATMLGGCAAPPTTTTETAGGPIQETDLTDEAGNALAEQAAADVKALEAMQADRELRDEAMTSSPRILWNDRRPVPPIRKPRSEQAANNTGWNPDDVVGENQSTATEMAAPQANDLDPAANAMIEAYDLNAPGEQQRLRELLVDLSKALYRESTYADMPLRELFLIAATTMISPDRALRADAMHGLTEREQELLLAFQTFFVTLGERLDGSRDAEEVIEETLGDLRRSITREPELEVPSAHLCTAVRGFADFDVFERNVFLAHSKQQAVVYAEVGSFSSEINDAGDHVTRIAQRLTIYAERDGIPVWTEDWQTAVDRSNKKRRDFFIVQVITLPKALSVGRYNLKIQLRDENSGAETETAIVFEMVADPKLAAGG